MPNVASAFYGAVLFIIGRDLNARQNLFCRRNLVRAHYQQGLFFCENAEPRKDVQNRVAREECAGEVPKVRDDIVLGVSPITCEFKAVTCFFGLAAGDRCTREFFNVAITCGIGVILSVRTIGYDEYLHVFIEATASPKAVALIAFDLVKRFPNGYSPPLEFDMN